MRVHIIDPKHKAASIAMLAMGAAMMILYPKNLLIGQAGWVWNYPSRHVAFEHMLVAVYVTLGAFLMWCARDAVRALPLIDFTIVSGVLHATVMWLDALQLPGMHDHLGWRGDVVGTYLAPVVLTLFHPRWRSPVPDAGPPSAPA